MKTYRELYFRGTSEQLANFVDKIGEYAIGNWNLVKASPKREEYLSFDYIGEEVDKARVFIYIGDILKDEEIRVVNIVPLEKSQLTVEEYNAILLKFYDDIIEPYKEDGTDLEISKPSDDNFDPRTVITDTALKKLEVFCSTANKSTGSSHPCDQERWFDFICQTVDDGKTFDYGTLAKFLQDESYWGKKEDNFNGVIGSCAWSEEQAYKLADEYESACDILEYYKKSRGI